MSVTAMLLRSQFLSNLFTVGGSFLPLVAPPCRGVRWCSARTPWPVSRPPPGWVTSLTGTSESTNGSFFLLKASLPTSSVVFSGPGNLLRKSPPGGDGGPGPVAWDRVATSDRLAVKCHETHLAPGRPPPQPSLMRDAALHVLLFLFSVDSELVPSGPSARASSRKRAQGAPGSQAPLGAWLLPAIREPGRCGEASSNLGSEAVKLQFWHILQSRWGPSTVNIGGAHGATNSRDPGTEPGAVSHSLSHEERAGYRRLYL